MIRLTLTPEERGALGAARRDRTLRPGERDRVEMLLLSAEGWGPPRIAAHLGCHPATVRAVIKRFRSDGMPALRRSRPGPPPDVARRAQVTAALDRLLGRERTWTAAQLALALGDEGVALSARQTRKYLRAMGARWRRTASTLAHKRDPERVARAKRTLAALKKRPPPGRSPWPSSTSAASAPASPPP
jgi:transposase